MASIVSQVEIAGSQAEVFSYVTDPTRFTEWQENVVDGRMEEGAELGIGPKCSTTRRIGGSERKVTSEITNSARQRTGPSTASADRSAPLST